MIEWLKQQYTKMLSNVFPTLPSYIARDCRDEFKEIYDVERLTENKRFEYEVTDTGQYYYDNGKRIFPEDFWQIIHDLNEENEQLKTVNTHLKNELSWIRDYAYWKEKDAFNKLFGAYMETCEEYQIVVKENEQLKKEILWWKYKCGEDISGDVE